MSFLKSDFLNFLESGIKYTDVVNRFGQPNINLGSISTSVGYYIEDDKMAVLNFGIKMYQLSEAYVMKKSIKKFKDMELNDSKIIEDIL